MSRKCPMCGGAGCTDYTTWNWLQSIRQKPYSLLTIFGDKRGSSSNQSPSSTPYPPGICRHCSPILPTPRSRALTLYSSPHLPNPTETPTENLRTASQSSGPFFFRLPLELRILIYGQLFGNRTVHINLEYPHNYTNEPRGKDGKWNLTVSRNVGKPKNWYAWHCVCHRNPRGSEWLDCCREEKDIKSYKININWLFTCRQG